MSLQTIRGLGWRLHTPADELERVANAAGGYYRPVTITKNGKKRLITAPTGVLRELQGRIYVEFLKPLELPDELHGGVLNKSPLTNALVHLGSQCVVSVDIKSFFPSITRFQVYDVWHRQLRLGPGPARLLTKLTTFRGCLPQGAPTSSSLANLVLLEADAKIKLRAEEAGEANSRFVDDLSFSGENPRDLIRPTARALAELGFRLNRRKVKVMSQRKLQEITGYSVNSRIAPSVPRYKRDRVRAAIRRLPQLIEEMGEEKALESLTGRINHIRQTNPGSAKRLQDQLRRALAAHSAARPGLLDLGRRATEVSSA